MAGSVEEVLVRRLSVLFGTPTVRDHARHWNIPFLSYADIHIVLDLASAPKLGTVWVFDPRERSGAAAMNYRVRELAEIDRVIERIEARAKS